MTDARAMEILREIVRHYSDWDYDRRLKNDTRNIGARLMFGRIPMLDAIERARVEFTIDLAAKELGE